MRELLGGSLFDGISGFPLAGSRHGIKFVWASEIESYPICVSRRHFPTMKHLGDVTKINGAEIEPVDIITFGSPCTDLSIAGKREGLGADTTKAARFRVKKAPPDWKRLRPITGTKVYEVDNVIHTRRGTRSGLFYHAVRIIREMQEATKDGTEGPKPTIAVWENVVGAFSSNAGRDFAAVLEKLVGGTVDVPRRGWTRAGVAFGPLGQVAWRTFDAQHWGVAQRRRRIYLVADFGGERAGQILFEPYSLSGDSQTCAEAGQDVAGGPACSPGTGGGAGGAVAADVCGPLCARDGKSGVGNQYAEEGKLVAVPGGRQEEVTPPVAQCLTSGTGRRYDAETETLIPVAQPIPPREPWIAPTLNASGSGMRRPGGSGAERDFYIPLAIDMQQVTSRANRSQPAPTAPTLHQAGGAHVIEPIHSLMLGSDPLYAEDLAQPITCRNGDPGCIAFSCKDHGQDAGEVAPTLRAMGHKDSHPNGGGQVAIVRTVAFTYNDHGQDAGSVSPTLRSFHDGGAGGVAIAQPTSFAVKTNQTGSNGSNVAEEAALTLNATDKQAVAMCYDPKDLGRRPAEFEEQSPTLKARAGTGGATSQLPSKPSATAFDVRNLRLTPMSGTLQAKESGSYSLNYQNPVMVPVLNGGDHDADEANARKVLSELRDQIGAEAFALWGLGVLDSLQSQEVLQSGVHGERFQGQTAESGREVVGGTQEGEDAPTSRPVHEMWGTERTGCSPQGRELAESQPREFGAHLPDVSQLGAQAKSVMLGLRETGQGVRTLREALSEVQEVRGPICGEGQSVRIGYTVRRLTPTECERLMGKPDGWTEWGVDKKGKRVNLRDTARYKALGNGLALPPTEFVMRRISEVIVN